MTEPSTPPRYAFDIVPGHGVGPILLGMQRDDIRAEMARAFSARLSASREKIDFFVENSLQIEYGQSGAADFIGVSQHASSLVTCWGVNVFDVEAPELFRLIAAHEPHPDQHKFAAGEYLFPTLIMTLWDADEQYDYVRKQNGSRIVYAQVGIGSPAYLAAVRAINVRDRRA